MWETGRKWGGRGGETTGRWAVTWSRWEPEGELLYNCDKEIIRNLERAPLKGTCTVYLVLWIWLEFLLMSTVFL